MKRSFNLITIVCLIIFQAAMADTFSVQGVLRDPLGKTVEDGYYTMTFNLYEAALEGSTVWTEIQNSVQVKHGVFNAELGSVNSLSPVTFNTTYWLGITIEQGQELVPRFKLLKSPAAMSVLGTDNVFPSRGNAGIGTHDPSAALHIKNVNDEANVVYIQSSSDETQFKVTSDNKVGIGIDPGAALHIDNSASDTKLLIADGATTYVKVTSDNKVGVGTDPGAALHVDNASQNTKLLISDGATTYVKVTSDNKVGVGTDPGAALHVDNASQDTKLLISDGATTYVKVTSDNKVGIGIDPGAALHIDNSASDTKLLIADGATTYVKVTSDNKIGVGLEPEASLHVRTQDDGVDKLRIEGSDGSPFVVVTGEGNLGINDPPNYDNPLSINGNLRLHGGGAIVFDDGTQVASANYGGAATGVASPGSAQINAAEGGSGTIELNLNSVNKVSVSNDQTDFSTSVKADRLGVGITWNNVAYAAQSDEEYLFLTKDASSNNRFHLKSDGSSSGLYADHFGIGAWFNDTQFAVRNRSTDNTYIALFQNTDNALSFAVDNDKVTWVRSIKDWDNGDYQVDPSGWSSLYGVNTKVIHDLDNTDYFLNPDGESHLTLVKAENFGVGVIWTNAAYAARSDEEYLFLTKDASSNNRFFLKSDGSSGGLYTEHFGIGSAWYNDTQLLVRSSASSPNGLLVEQSNGNDILIVRSDDRRIALGYSFNNVGWTIRDYDQHQYAAYACNTGGNYLWSVDNVGLAASRSGFAVEFPESYERSGGLTNSLEKIMDVNSAIYPSHSSKIGLITEEIESKFPDLVSYREPARDSLGVAVEEGGNVINMSSFSVVLMEAIKELKTEKDAEVQALKDEYDSKIATLINRIERLENR